MFLSGDFTVTEACRSAGRPEWVPDAHKDVPTTVCLWRKQVVWHWCLKFPRLPIRYQHVGAGCQEPCGVPTLSVMGLERPFIFTLRFWMSAWCPRKRPGWGSAPNSATSWPWMSILATWCLGFCPFFFFFNTDSQTWSVALTRGLTQSYGTLSTTKVAFRPRKFVVGQDSEASSSSVPRLLFFDFMLGLSDVLILWLSFSWKSKQHQGNISC